MSGFDLERNQRNVCKAHGCEFHPALGQDKAGVALSTLGVSPIHGLRHPPSGGTTGWYIWCGEILSDASDFFDPVCVDHLIKELPLVASLLGLPPGYRFVVADGYRDVWCDENLFNV